MTNPRPQWLLKVIAGPHQGAEVGMRIGKMLIGSDEECDVLLHDLLVAPQHAEIEATANGITVAPLGGRVFVNGKRVRDARQVVPDFAFVTIGGSHLIIGPDGAKWPLLSAADVPDLEKEVDANVAPEPKPEEAAPSPNATGVITPLAPALVANRQTRTRAYLGIGVGVALLLVWGVAYLKFTGDTTLETEAAAKPADRARAVVESMGLSDSIKIEVRGGHVAVSGYVDTEARQRELQASFRQAVPGLNTRIYSLEKIASSARALLDAEAMPLTVTSLSEGRLRVAGKLRSAEPWVRMRHSLRKSVPGLSEIEDGVEIDTPRLAPAPRQGVVQPAIVTTKAATVTHVPATLPPIASGAAPDPAADYSITPDTIDSLESKVAAIKVGPDSLSYIRLTSGGIYFEGARLPFGGKITGIDHLGVNIEEKGRRRRVEQGDLVAEAKEPLSAFSSAAQIP